MAAYKKNHKPNAFSISVFSFIVLLTLRLYIVLFIEAVNPFGFASDEAAVPMLTYFDLNFAMYTNPKR